MEKGDKLFMCNSAGLGRYVITEEEVHEVYKHCENSLKFQFCVRLKVLCQDHLTEKKVGRTFDHTNINTNGYQFVADMYPLKYSVAFFTTKENLINHIKFEKLCIEEFLNNTNKILEEIS